MMFYLNHLTTSKVEDIPIMMVGSGNLQKKEFQSLAQLHFSIGIQEYIFYFQMSSFFVHQHPKVEVLPKETSYFWSLR